MSENVGLKGAFFYMHLVSSLCYLSFIIDWVSAASDDYNWRNLTVLASSFLGIL